MPEATNTVKEVVATPAPAGGNPFPEVQASSSTVVDTKPAVEAKSEAGTGLDLLNVEELDAEKSVDGARENTKSGAKVETKEDPAVAQTFNLLKDSLGDLEDLAELKLDGFYDKLSPEHVKDLPTPARQILHNVRKAYALEQQKHVAEMSKLREDLLKEKRSLATQQTDFLRQQQEFSALIESPEVKAVLDGPKLENVDPYTEEGRKLILKKEAAEGIREIFKPMQEAAEKQRKQLQYRTFEESHPEMKDSVFKKEVYNLLMQRKDIAPLQTEDAYRIIKLRRLEAQDGARRQQEVSARAKSAQHVARTTTAGTASTATIPKEVMKQGGPAIAAWLQQNPSAHEQIRARR